MVSELIARLRKRLYVISLFMRCINNPNIHQANQKGG
jgi:hypothetical protein